MVSYLQEQNSNRPERGDTVKAVACVKGIEREKRLVTIETDCFNQNGDAVVKGEAVVLLDPVD